MDRNIPGSLLVSNNLLQKRHVTVRTPPPPASFPPFQMWFRLYSATDPLTPQRIELLTRPLSLSLSPSTLENHFSNTPTPLSLGNSLPSTCRAWKEGSAPLFTLRKSMQGGGRDTTLMEFPIPRGSERARSSQSFFWMKNRHEMNCGVSGKGLFSDRFWGSLSWSLTIPYLMSKAALNRNIPQIGFIENSFIGILWVWVKSRLWIGNTDTEMTKYLLSLSKQYRENENTAEWAQHVLRLPAVHRCTKLGK